MTLDVDRVAEALLEVTVALIAKKMAPIEARIAELEQQRGLKYLGIWSASVETYVRGNLVTCDGMLWHANATTRTKPGTGTDWSMMHKTGVGR